MGGRPYEGVILSPLKFMPGAVKEIDEERVAVIQQGQQKKGMGVFMAETERKGRIGLIIQNSRKTYELH